MCDCGCNICEDKKPVMLNESVAPREILSEGLKYHLDNARPLTEHVYRAGSDSYFNLWAEAVHVLTKSYLPTNEDEAKYCISFHYDQVRPEGSPISIGGVAPGPKVLEVAIEKVRFILDKIQI